MMGQHEDVIILLEKRIVSLEMTRAVGLEWEYYSLVRACDRRIDECNFIIKLIEKL
jgi:hypothetical protein